MHAELCRLLDRQGGVVTSAQALTFLTRRGLEAQLNCGALQKIWYGIYGRDEVTIALRLRGLVLAAGATVAACMGTQLLRSGSTPNEPRICTCSILPAGNCDRPRA